MSHQGGGVHSASLKLPLQAGTFTVRVQLARPGRSRLHTTTHLLVRPRATLPWGLWSRPPPPAAAACSVLAALLALGTLAAVGSAAPGRR
jgi:hypothetical protein